MSYKRADLRANSFAEMVFSKLGLVFSVKSMRLKERSFETMKISSMMKSAIGGALLILVGRWRLQCVARGHKINQVQVTQNRGDETLASFGVTGSKIPQKVKS